MNGLYCNESSQHYPSIADFKDLRPTIITNCIFNSFLTYTAIMFNIVTIYAIHKAATIAKPLKTLLLHLAFSDVAVGLFGQPLYISLLIKWLRMENPSCNAYLILSISGALFSLASSLGVVAVSMERFLAVHLHLRYQELVTHKRVVYMVISIWVYSIFVSSMTLWGLRSTRDAIGLASAAIGFILTFMFYIKIYLTVRRHKNQIQSMPIREEAQSDEIKKFATLIKSTISIFYVTIVLAICYLPFQICSAGFRIYGSGIALKKFYLLSVTLIFLNSSLNPVIYCWKMRHIRRGIIDVVWNLSRERHPSRCIYNGSSNVVLADN
ncbi:adenosine receptor A2a-like [Pocillopora verrucosa]|uniref:adenosine receptor A2a-like n=1 Tax=Pocillopora verrucosa TaxID=203993 RepID=UPI00333EF5BA